MRTRPCSVVVCTALSATIAARMIAEHRAAEELFELVKAVIFVICYGYFFEFTKAAVEKKTFCGSLYAITDFVFLGVNRHRRDDTSFR